MPLRVYGCKKTLVIVSAMIIALFAFAGCSGGKKPAESSRKNASAPPASGEYKIGAIFSITGSASNLGVPERNTLELLAERLNAAGGINGVPVKLLIEDDAGVIENTKMALIKLADVDNVIAIIGPSRSGNTMAIKQLANEKKVPLLSCAAAEAIVNPVSKWVFKIPQKDSYVAQHILKYMREKGISNIAVLYGNTGFGQEGLAHIKRLANDYGVNIVFEEAYQPTATGADLEAQLKRAKDRGDVQAIINWSILPAQSVIPKKMKTLGMDDVILFHSHGFGNKKFADMAGDAANGIIFPSGRLLVAERLPDGHPQKAGLVQYKYEYENRYGEDVSAFGGHAHDAFWIVVKAIEASGGVDRASVRDAIENIRGFTGTGGVYNFSESDHNGLDVSSLEMLTVRDGSFDLLVR